MNRIGRSLVVVVAVLLYAGAAGAADVSVVKTLVTSGPYFAGQSVTYRLVVANGGPGAATNVRVTDTPSNLFINGVSGGCWVLPCTIPSLAAGASVTLDVTATISRAGPFDNTASVAAAEADPDPTNNTDDRDNGGTATLAADVSIVKTLTTPGPYVAGQSIRYSLAISNHGPSAATNLRIDDTPSNLTITPVSGGCGRFPCTFGLLGARVTAFIDVTATIDGPGPFDNSASVTADEPDPDPSNNTDAAGNGGTAGTSADLSIVKTLTTAGPYAPGQSIGYTLTVANAGPSAATAVQVTDTPTNLTITGVTGGGCTALPCTIARIAAGAAVTLALTATIDAAGDFDNSAAVTASDPDPDPTDNADRSGNGSFTGPAADVSIVKTLSHEGPYVPGLPVYYVIAVTNAGPATATNVRVTDTPENLTIVGVAGGCSQFPCGLASIAPGETVTIEVHAVIRTAGAFDNGATATPSERDPDPTNNTDPSGNGGDTGPFADVSIVKTPLTPGPYTPEQSVLYSLVVANAGPSTATGVRVTDTPANLTEMRVSGACSRMPCTIPTLPSGASVTIFVSGTIAVSGAFDNVASVLADQQDLDLSNNTDDTGNGGTAGTPADLSVAKTLTTAGPFAPGQTVSYTLLVENLGPSPATAVQVTDTPSNLTIAGVSGGGCSALPCTIPSLARGEMVRIDVAARIGAAGPFDNAASVTAVEPDPDPSGNTDATANGGTASVPPSADLSLTKTASVALTGVGRTFDYTLVVRNGGPSPATGVVVTDTLPAGFSLSSATATQGTCSGTATLTCQVGAMAVNAVVTITVRGTATAEGTLANSATVAAAEDDPVTGNNTSTAAVGVAANIPTLDARALAALATLLAAAAVFLRR